MRERGARFSLAWRLLAFEPRRLAAAVAGVAFAVILVLVQIGFYGAMIASATQVHRNFDTDLVMFPAGFEYLGSAHDFARVRLMQAAADPAVESVAPLYVTLVNFKNVDTGFDRSIMAIAVEPGARELRLPNVLRLEDRLDIGGDVLFDEKGLAAYYGDVPDRFAKSGPFQAFIDGRPVTVAGLFNLGTSFVAFGTVVMGTQTFFALHSDLTPELPSLGLIKLRPGVDAEAARQRIERALGVADVVVETKDAFVQREIDYWNTTAAIGFIFIAGAFMGVLVGAVVVYQILYADVTEHLPEYATLRAMGFAGRYFARLVLGQSLILSALGFAPGVLAAWAVYRLTAAETGYTMDLGIDRAILVFALTAAMCAAAGLLAMRRLQLADPTELFR
jgi:putative ABC transport system permease protein